MNLKFDLQIIATTERDEVSRCNHHDNVISNTETTNIYMNKMIKEEYGSRFKDIFKRAILSSEYVLKDEKAYEALED
jgi:hypothetical protein